MVYTTDDPNISSVRNTASTCFRVMAVFCTGSNKIVPVVPVGPVTGASNEFGDRWGPGDR